MAKLILALDDMDGRQALSIVKPLAEDIEWVKVGLELFTREGPGVVESLKALGFKVMLDLKLFDIPNTVEKSVRSSRAIGADLITLHLLGGEKMIKAAAQEIKNAREQKEPGPLLFGVTVLTSMKQGDLPGYSQDIRSLTIELTENAHSWGLDGVVCSGQEVSTLKRKRPSLLYLTPGIRASQNKSHDQERIVTPQEAVLAGSDFLVVGRPITQSERPDQAVKTFIQMIQGQN